MNSNISPIEMKGEYTVLFYTAKEFSQINTESTEDIVDGICPVGLTLLFGPEKSGKSLLARQLAKSVSEGDGDFLNHKVKIKGNVVYFSLDDSMKTIHSRFDRFDHYDNFFIITPHNFNEAQRYGKEYTLIGYVFMILDEIREKYGRISYVVIDTLEKVRKNIEKRDYASEVKELNVMKQKAEEMGSNFTLVHHSTKNTKNDPIYNYYGSKGVGAEVDVLISLTNTDDKNIQSICIAGNNIPREELLVSKNEQFQFQIENINREELLSDETEKSCLKVIKYLTEHAKNSPTKKYHWEGMFSDLITEMDLDITPKKINRMFSGHASDFESSRITFNIKRKKQGMNVFLNIDRSGEEEE